MYRFLVITCLCVVAALVGLLALAPREPQPDLRIVNGAHVHDLDPARMSWMHDIRTACGLWEGLLTGDPRTGSPIPGVAERYEVSADGKIYTFHLRPDARWSNGDPVTAGDFAFAWFRVLDPANAANYYTYLTLIDGAAAYYQAMKGYQNWLAEHGWPDGPALAAMPNPPAPPSRDAVGIRVLDDRTLAVRLARPVAYFPELAAFATFLPVHEKSMAPFLVRPRGQGPFYSYDWLKPGNLVSNGPFALERWDFHYRLVLRRNEHYWDRDRVPSSRIELLDNPDPNTAFQLYESGNADLLTDLPKDVAPILLGLQRQGRRDDLHIFPVLGTYYYRFNCARTPLNDPRVRKALAQTIDRQAIVRFITRRGERAQTSFVTPGLGVTLPSGRRIEYQPAEGLAFDPAAARKLLAEAGYGPGSRSLVAPDGRPLKLLFNESPQHLPIAQAVQKMWHDHLGVTVELDMKLSKIAGAQMRGHNFDIARSGWFTDYPDPSGFLFMFTTADGQNDGQFSDPRYDALMARAADEPDPARRYELLRQAEAILVAEQAGLVPIYQYVGQYLFRPDIGGVFENPTQQIMLKHVFKRR